MDIETEEKNGILIVRPQEMRIDASNALEFKAAMMEIVGNGYVNLIVTLASLNFIDSSGLGVLVSVMKTIGSRGEIKLCEAEGDVKSIFELTRLDNIFSFYHSESEALNSF